METMETLVPFLGKVGSIVQRKDVAEVMINGDRNVFYVGPGGMRFAGCEMVSQDDLEEFVKRVGRDRMDETRESLPILDGMLPDGSRVAAIMPPCSVGGIAVTIRKFRPSWFTMSELVANGTIPAEMSGILRAAATERATFLVSGGTGSGKTTIVRALMDSIPDTERIGVIEDTPELEIKHPNCFRFVSRREQRNDQGKVSVQPVTIRELVRHALRNFPTRLIIGEVRGAEAFDLIDALNTGHAGSISTLHANSGVQALHRLASLAMRAGVDVPYLEIQQDIGDRIDYVLHVAQQPDGSRRVMSIDSVTGFDRKAGMFLTETVL